MKVAAVTGGRADWGLLSMPLAALRRDPAFEVSLIVTGQHLAQGESDSLAAIAADGFPEAERVDISVGDDTPVGVSRTAGLAVAGIAQTLASTRPDLLLVLGDRYEILAAAMSALLSRIPVAHLCGGDITEGAMDDSIRHAITKLSHLHFVTHADARKRVIQLGENPERVFCVGSPGLDRILGASLIPKDRWLEDVGLPRRSRTLVVTYHPVTLELDPLAECRELLAALDSLGDDVAILFTGANADPGARGIDGLVHEFVASHKNARAVRSLSSDRYFSAISHADAVVGNSSSGLYEAPSFKTPTVNIGDRQKGRLRAASVIDCAGNRNEIRKAIERAQSLDCRNVENPYGDGRASECIVSILKGIGDPSSLIHKRFFGVPIEGLE